jgi:hypothetical protein
MRADRGIPTRDLVRLTGAVLREAAVKLGIRRQDYGFDLCRWRDLLNAAQRGELSAEDYRCICEIRRRTPSRSACVQRPRTLMLLSSASSDRTNRAIKGRMYDASFKNRVGRRYCSQRFLVDSRQRKCDGPGDRHECSGRSPYSG